MNIKEISGKLDLELSEVELKGLEGQTKIIIKEIEIELKKLRAKAEVFVGGSFAKQTLMKREKYDIDIFVRFEKNQEEISKILESALVKVSNILRLELKRVHGSRDYYALKSNNVLFEIVPVTKINKPEEAGNSTDLSYFHVKYVNGKVKKNPKLRRDIIIAKAFCRAQGVYGAESWVHGFSGYSLECLVIAYGGFERMLKALSKSEGQVILDPEKKYKKKNEISIELNESKRKGPIILVDPTFKQRNVCSALSQETFDKFKLCARLFLKKSGISFFEYKKIDEEKLRNRAKKIKGEFIKLLVRSDKQEGDIAGAKLEKFYRFLLEEVGKFYELKDKVFEFDEGHESEVYLIVKPNKNAVQVGPPLKMIEEGKIFKKAHKNAFVKAGRLYSPIKVEPIHTFLEKWKTKREGQIKDMDVCELQVI
ncbi:MAG: nucleotidyltransferase domain-containing protein [Nanoarchaeota archaeon]